MIYNTFFKSIIIFALCVSILLSSIFSVIGAEIDVTAEVYNMYYATITNPHDHKLTMPVEIKCSFDKGEVPSANNVHIYDVNDESKTLIPHRYDGERNAAYFQKLDNRYYDDNSLKCGSFWIIDTLGPNETKTYAIKISNEEH